MTRGVAMAFARIAVLILLTCSVAVRADVLYVYPTRGQSDQQLADDRWACHQWAVQESGFDPSLVNEPAPPTTVTVPVPRNEAEGSTAKGAVVGAVAGGIIGAHGHDSAEGAVIGAAIGTIAGAAIEEQGRQAAQDQAAADAKREAEALARTRSEGALRRSNYQRALMACLEGRGYTVK